MSNLKRKLNDEGIALVSVMIVLTVCLLIASTILEITYFSLLSRRISTKSTDNFYSAEVALEDMETVLQSVALYSVNQIRSNPTTNFVDLATQTLNTSAGTTDISSTAGKAALSRYLFNSLDDDIKKILGTESGGTYVYSASNFKVTDVGVKTDGGGGTVKTALVITVEFNYVNENGFMTSISTDIVMRDVTTRTPATAESIGSYSCFNGGGADFPESNDYSTGEVVYFQEGSCYFGTQAGTSTSVSVKKVGLIFDGDRVIFNGDLVLKDHAYVAFDGYHVKSDGSVVYPMVDVKGKVYIDSTSAMIISEGCDFMCQDIVFVDGTTEYSAFAGTKPYIKANGSQHYPAMFPLNTDSKNLVMTNGTQALHGDWFSGGFTNKVGGAVLYRVPEGGTNAGTYVMQYNASSGNWTTLGGPTVGATINHSDSFGTEALATVFCHDGTAQTVDAELAVVDNIQVMYMQTKIGDGAVVKGSSRVINKNIAGVISSLDYSATADPMKDQLDAYFTKQNFTLGPINDLRIYTINGVTQSNLSSYLTDASVAKAYLAPLRNNALGSGTPDYYVNLGSSAGVTVNASNDNLHLLNNLLGYDVQMNGGQNTVGIFISADKVVYKPMGKGTIVARSILSVKDKYGAGSEVWTNMQKSVVAIAFSENAQDNLWQVSAGTPLHPDLLGSNTSTDMYQNAYALGMVNNTFENGVASLLDETTGGGGIADVSVNINGMYDLISVQNWTVN